MNDETPEPFDTVGDEPVEARIVAWVLGEASAFEAAELERLCEERPELLVFRRRMRALHGLLTEAEASEADHSWKLPTEKRKLLDEIFGEETVPESDSHKEQRVNFSARRAFLTIAACLLLTAVIAGLSAPMVMRQRKRADAVVRHVDFMPSSGGGGQSSLEALNKAVRDQENMVEEHRKALATNDRTKGINYKGQDSFYRQSGADEDQVPREEAIRRGLDSQDYADAKRDYEADQELLQTMKLKQIELEVNQAAQPQALAANGKAPAPSVTTAPATPPAPSQPAAAPALPEGAATGFGMSLAKSKEGIAEQQDAKVRARMATANKAEQPVVEMAPELPELADSSKLDSIQDASGNRWSGALGLQSGHGFGGGARALAEQSNEAPASDLPSASGDVAGNLAYGLRSGDSAVSRNSIDAILNAPRATAAPAAEFMPTLAAKDAVDPSRKPASAAVVSGMTSTSSFSRGQAGGEGLTVGEKSNQAKEFEGYVDNGAPVADGLKKTEESKTMDERKGGKLSDVGGLADRDGSIQFESSLRSESQSNFDLVKRLESKDGPLMSGEVNFTGGALRLQAGLEVEDREDPFAETAGRGAPLAAGRPVEIQPVPKPLVDLMEEIPASENPYSTFSLNISDASFQLAKAALAKGERPDPEGIKVEQFYNAVDYGDPAPSSNQPVAATVEQSAHPVIPGRNLVRVALRTASVGRSASQPLRLTLLVDQSGSMVREDRRAAMENALKQLGGLLTKNDSISIIGFSRTPHLLADGLTGDQGAKLGEIINQTSSEGGTNLEEAMKLAAQKAGESQLAGAQNRIVLFTDGAANLGNADPDKLAKQVTALRQKGIAFDIAGIGADGLNDRLLGELARHGNGRYYVVGNEKNDSFARQLAGAFRPAAENVKVQVNFNPQRVGKYKLIGFEKDRLKTEDFRNDAVDAAELAADEAGVALYQVEPLAEGSGEIGEVSVRFRDTASGGMVERTWTIPFESSATAFDRATPSMQLAGLSLLAGEKLKGGPMAEAIDFKQFAAPLAQVRQVYGASHGVADMLQVIDALK